MALTKRDLQEIGKVVEEKLDKRFTENDKKWDVKLAERFAENDKKWDVKLDKRFAENDKKWDVKLAERFAENDKKWDVKLDKKLDNRFAKYSKEWNVQFDKKIKKNNVELVTRLMKEMPSKQDLEDKAEEIKDDLRDRIMGVQEAVLLLHQKWELGQPVMVKGRLEEHEKRIAVLEEEVGVSCEDK